jgi:hypothetical protein
LNVDISRWFLWQLWVVYPENKNNPGTNVGVQYELKRYHIEPLHPILPDIRALRRGAVELVAGPDVENAVKVGDVERGAVDAEFAPGGTSSWIFFKYIELVKLLIRNRHDDGSVQNWQR